MKRTIASSLTVLTIILLLIGCSTNNNGKSKDTSSKDAKSEKIASSKKAASESKAKERSKKKAESESKAKASSIAKAQSESKASSETLAQSQAESAKQASSQQAQTAQQSQASSQVTPQQANPADESTWNLPYKGYSSYNAYIQANNGDPDVQKDTQNKQIEWAKQNGLLDANGNPTQKEKALESSVDAESEDEDDYVPNP